MGLVLIKVFDFKPLADICLDFAETVKLCEKLHALFCILIQFRVFELLWNSLGWFREDEEFSVGLSQVLEVKDLNTIPCIDRMHLLFKKALTELKACSLENKVSSEFECLTQSLEVQEILLSLSKTLVSLNRFVFDPLTRNSFLDKLTLHLGLKYVKQVFSSLLQEYVIVSFPGLINIKVIH